MHTCSWKFGTEKFQLSVPLWATRRLIGAAEVLQSVLGYKLPNLSSLWLSPLSDRGDEIAASVSWRGSTG